MSKKKITQTNTHITSALKEGCYLQAAKFLFERAKIDYPSIDSVVQNEKEYAKAFWIGLTYDKFENSIDSEIIFYCTGLYDDYFALGAEARRRKFFMESNYKGKISDSELLSINNRDLPLEQIKSKSKYLYKTEDARLESLIEHFMNKTEKLLFFKNACIKYTITLPSKIIRKSISIKSKYTNKIFYVEKIENFNFCGREDILDTIEKNFDNNTKPCIQLLYGMGGVGKTQIALKYAYLHRNKFDAVVWLDAFNLTTLIKCCVSFLKENAYEINVSALIDADVIISSFIKYINDQANSFIIIDNVDYLDKNSDKAIATKDAITKIICANKGKILITTRCDCDFNGATRTKVDVFSPKLSIEYLRAKTALNPDKSAKLLVKKLGYLPLALEYVSGYIKTNRISYGDYLELWDNYGINLFDKTDYTEHTIRQAFSITLEKLKTSNLYNILIELLRVCSYWKDSYVPLKSYLDIERKNEKEFIDDIKSSLESDEVFFSLLYDYVRKEIVWCEYIKYLGDDSFSVDVFLPDKTTRTTITLSSPFIKILENTLDRNEIIRKLTEYSLLEWDGERLKIHQMLREIIIDETPKKEHDNYWKKHFTYDIVSQVYDLYGDDKKSQKNDFLYKKQSLCNILSFASTLKKHIENNETLKQIHGQMFICYSSIMDCIINEIIPYGNTDLIAFSKEVYKEIFNCFWGNYNLSDPETKSSRLIDKEKQFWTMISNLLGKELMYRSFVTPYKPMNYKYRYVLINPTNIESVNKNSEAFVDIFLEGNREKVIEQLKKIISSENNIWYSIALPKGMTIKEEELL